MIEKLRRWAGALKTQQLTLGFSRSHPDTPLTAKLLAGFVVAYAFSPIDLIPDFIPVLGYLDDLVIVPLGIYITLRLIPAHVIVDSRKKAEVWLAENRNRPRNYVAAAIVIFIWGALAYWAWSVLSG